MPSTAKGHGREWTTADATTYYGLKNWGGRHFSADDAGFLQVHPLGDHRSIRIHDIVTEAIGKGYKPPLTIRIQDLLRTRVVELNQLFDEAIQDESYGGKYRGVFPIKVNQLREVVEEIRDAGKAFHYGLECGSKPELMIALAMHKDPESLIICNGYKDDEFIRLALFGRKLGKEIYLVVEQLSEVPRIIQISKKLGIKPLIGLRVKLSTMGEGKWASSSGEDAKFGLTSPEIIDATRRIKRAGLTDSLRLVHFHIGSQVPNIQTIKKATVEAARFYCELKKMGFPMELLDVGGGLGIDYDGSRSNYESSMNYTMREYARDVVYNVKTVCADADVEVPDLVTESGRAIVAPHSILVTEVCDRISKKSVPPKKTAASKKQNPVLRDLNAILENEHGSSPLERFHDSQQKREEANNLFNLGYLDLRERAQADAIYWKICEELSNLSKNGSYTPEELESLPAMMADQYVCNFSVFQSLIDHWACDQLFPIAPLQRLNEEPEVDATLVDITCDSEGKVSKFTDVEDVRQTLKLHDLKPKEAYYLGVFLVGAYQDIMGDLHNLFGRVNEVHVFLEDDEEDGFYIEDSIRGFAVSDVLGFTQYDGHILTRRMKKQIDRATKDDEIKPREGTRMLDEYAEFLRGHTYLAT
ncbi:arginine decarboxylase [Coraliomargarita sinensis]|uniref:Arginine decarboxylase n=1 Tax=Coraliomargarita sinensis TaxID=2174842 RepID=A0A317ZDN1_9BACT|nr:biosynthetic arginine decarboxylase [Coraliomargarita sinensis]PXA03190.1 arginine decarboxylase [Coraliomargarita sinensis]